MGAASNYRRATNAYAPPATQYWTPANSRDFTSSYIEIPHFCQHLPTDSVTIEFWAFFNSLTPNFAFANASGASGSNRFTSHAPWANGRLYWDHGDLSAPDSQARIDVDVSGYQSQWVHFELRISQPEGARSIHVKGERLQYYGRYNPYTPADESFYIGGMPGGGLNYPGRLGEMRIWATDRGYYELREPSTRLVTGPEPGLLACWRLDDNVPVGGKILDRSGNGFHGILH